MTPDDTTGSHGSDKDRPRRRGQSIGHHHRSAAAKPQQSSSATPHRHSSNGQRRSDHPEPEPAKQQADKRGKRQADEHGEQQADGQEDSLSDDREQDSSDETEQDSSDETEQDSSDETEQDSSRDRDRDSATEPEQDSRDGASKRRTAAWAIAAVRSQFSDLSGQSVEQITGVDKGDDSTWTVGVEVVEIRMVPDTADILAQYDVKVDQDGDVIGYRRVRRYLRGRADG